MCGMKWFHLRMIRTFFAMGSSFIFVCCIHLPCILLTQLFIDVNFKAYFIHKNNIHNFIYTRALIGSLCFYKYIYIYNVCIKTIIIFIPEYIRCSHLDDLLGVAIQYLSIQYYSQHFTIWKLLFFLILKFYKKINSNNVLT